MRSIAGWIEAHARFSPDKTAVRFGDRSLSYRDFAARIATLSAWLGAHPRLERGSRIAWLGHNSPEFLALLFACAEREMILVPLNWRLSAVEIGAVLTDAGAALLLVEPAYAQMCGSLPGIDTVRLSDDAHDYARVPGRAPLATTLRVSNVAATAPVLLVYTSGTTGTPKGVLLTQQALLFNALNAVHMHDMSAADRVLTVLPMFHVGGLNIQTLPALYCGAEVILEARFDANATLARITGYRPTLTTLVPATIAALMALPTWPAADVSCLRAVTTGSTDVPHQHIDALHRRGIPVIQIYGSTETGPVAIYQRIEEAYRSAGSIGRRGLHTEVRLVTQDGSDAAVGTPGEIHVRGPHVASGYWDAASARALPFADGWFASGDVAECDAEGLYWFRDRIKHVIISGGENIYPAELERVLNASGLLREAAVAGRRDERWGEVPVVVAVREGSGVDERQVLAVFDQHLARYKRPRAVLFVDSLPRNVMGKVEVARLRELVNGH